MLPKRNDEVVAGAGSSEGARVGDAVEEWGDSSEDDPEEWLDGSVNWTEVGIFGRSRRLWKNI